jgi:hypothetical protein
MRPRLSYIGTVPVLLSALYAMFANVTSRMHFFATLAMTSIGASEVVLFLHAVIRDRRVSGSVVRHGLLSVGGLLMGYALLHNLSPIEFVTGALCFASALLIEDAITSPTTL